jgi:hypothetical protein
MLIESYLRYVKENIDLVSSMVIKSETTANSYNNYLKLLGIDTPDDPSLWYYYNCISANDFSHLGLPIPEIPIHILETNITIPLVRTLQLDYPHTFNHYLSNPQLIKKLISSYPEDELYIKGIFYPVDKDIALKAKDFTILSYNKDLVHYNETNLIAKTQEWIYNFTHRWYDPKLALSDNWHDIAFLAILFVNLPVTIINIRLDNCKTEYVHPFHLWNYLGGYFELHKYKGKIPFEQAKFLYRNIRYITKNAGKESVLEFLNNGFCKPFGLALYTIKLERDELNLVKNFTENQSHYQPITYFKKDKLNDEDLSNQQVNYLTPDTIVSKLIPLGTKNVENVQDDINDLVNIAANNTINSAETGLLECNSVNSFRDTVINKIINRINYIIYLSNFGYYTNTQYVNFTSISVYDKELSIKDAIVLLFYVAAKLYDIPLVNIPNIEASGILLPNEYLTDTLSKIRPSSYLESFLHNGHRVNIDILTRIKNTVVPPRLILNNTDLDSFMEQISNAKLNLHLLNYQLNDSLVESEIDTLVNSFQRTINCPLVSEVTYSDFLNRLGLDITNLESSQYIDILKTILVNFLQIDREFNHLQSPYKEMVEILNTITSYLLQFVLGDNTIGSYSTYWDTPNFKILNKKVKYLIRLLFTNNLDIGISKSIDLGNYDIPVGVGNINISKSVSYDSILNVNLNILCTYKLSHISSINVGGANYTCEVTE